MNKYDYLVIDIGSTYTKQRLFKDFKLITSVQSPTTTDDVYKGISKGREKIKSILQEDKIEVTHTLSSSSAAGGLRMVAMGYMARVTAKAAKEVAMNSGAKILEIISNDDLPDHRIEILQEIKPDIILLAGGTDFGDEESLIENATLIVESKSKATVLIAGNIKAQPKVAKILKAANIPYIRIPNIMPTIHELKVDQARNEIHKEFIKQIIKGQGLSTLQNEITNKKIIPTPGAVLMAAELLAKGTYEDDGIGDVIVIDLGGATTDIHSVIPEYEKLNSEEIGLIVSNEKQISYRTVEGNLGMRVSATGVISAVNPKAILKKANILDDVVLEEFTQYCESLEINPEYIAQNNKEYEFDTLIAQTCIEVALKRHAGYICTKPDPITGISPGMPVGRDLRNVTKIIGVGGIFAHRTIEEGQKIIKNALKDKGISLLPTSYEVIIDKNYILYTGGVIGQINQEDAFKILKQNI